MSYNDRRGRGWQKNAYHDKRIADKKGNSNHHQEFDENEGVVEVPIGPIVYFNKEFQDSVPLYFLDSGIIISLGKVKLLEDRGATDEQLLYALQKGNPRNIDSASAEIILDLYKKNKKGEVAFCVPPAVYKETMIDGSPSKRDRIDRVYTRKFVTENCFLTFPDEDLNKFAIETAKVQDALKSVHTTDRFFGLNPEMKNGRDDNFEDRLIVSQVAVLGMHGKQNVHFISCSSASERDLSREVSRLYDRTQGVNPRRENPDITKNSGDRFVLLQINSKDFGKRNLKGIHGNEAEGKAEVSRKLEQQIANLFGTKGGVIVLTPEELDYFLTQEGGV